MSALECGRADRAGSQSCHRGLWSSRLLRHCRPASTSHCKGRFVPTRVYCCCSFFFFQAEDGIRDYKVTGVQTCALPISLNVTLVALPFKSLIWVATAPSQLYVVSGVVPMTGSTVDVANVLPQVEVASG